MISMRTCLVLPLFCFLNLIAFSQNNMDDEIFRSYDKIVGLENTGFFNGTEFTDPYLNTNGTYRYFKGFDYVKGSVTYNGQHYEDVLLKYDLFEDNLLTRSNDNLAIFNVKLIPSQIRAFSIYNHNFVRIDTINLGVSGNGFYEVAFKGTAFELYIKRAKKKRDKAVKSGMQYIFSSSDLYILNHKGNYTILGSQRDLRKNFPAFEEEIRNFYKSNKTLNSLDSDRFMINLISFLDGLNTQKNLY